MTDKQRLAALRRAVQHLRRTTQSYLEYEESGVGSEWMAALRDLEILERDLMRSQVPNLGPVWKGGRSVLDHDLTHATSGIPLYPAFDDAFSAGTPIIAPEPITVTKDSSSNPGDAFYALGRSGIRYWFGHLSRAPITGTKFDRGAVVGKVLDHNVGGGPHVHVGVNVELLLGKGRELVHHTNYTHGAPTVRRQLTTWLDK